MILRKIGVTNSQIKDSVEIVEPVNIYGAVIGSACFIGPFVEIQNGVKLGDGVRVQSHAFICEGVTVGDQSFIGHGVMFVNDHFANGGPARGNRKLYRYAELGARVSVGSGAVIMGVRIADDVIIGAGSVVTRDVLVPGSRVAGNPARFLN